MNQVTSPAGVVVLESKLHPPVLHPEHVTRPRLLRLVDAGASRRLTLVGAPAGYGKSTLLADWCRTEAAVGRVAWLTLDAHDNDPIAFWTYVIQALRRVEPDHFGSALALLGTPGVSLTRSVLPQLLNELWTLDRPLALIWDDYHEISNTDCHEALTFFLRRLPPMLHLIIATRWDPPLELGRLRAGGDLCEFRAADLCFVGDEVGALLNDSLELGLDATDLERLEARTEGWAAGLYLAALSLRKRADASAFIAEFAGDDRHLVAYLGNEVLRGLSEDVRAFLVQTSILDRFSVSLCDAVVPAAGSAERLQTLERTNLFVTAIDQRGAWYRYHPLFRELLQLELKQTRPDLVPVLHARAAAWYRAAGNAISAMRHALAAGDFDLAGDLFLEYAQPLNQAGHLGTVLNWLDALPDETIAARPPLAVAAAWIAGVASRPPQESERWLASAEASDYAGPFNLGEHSLRGAVALVRAVFPFDDVGRALTAAQIAVEEETDPRMLSYLLARMALGHCLYLAGRPAEARESIEEALRAPLAERQTNGVIRAMADLAFVSLELGDVDRADDLARRAVEMCERYERTAHPNVERASLALSAVLAQDSRFDQAEAALARGVEPYLPALRRWPIAYARALLGMAPVRFARGHMQAAHALLAEARTVIGGCADPGMLATLLAATEQRLQRMPRRRTALLDELTEGELRILRLLVSDLNQREIGRELFVSMNTIKTHMRTIYAKLGVTSREAAIIRARSLSLIS